MSVFLKLIFTCAWVAAIGAIAINPTNSTNNSDVECENNSTCSACSNGCVFLKVENCTLINGPFICANSTVEASYLNCTQKITNCESFDASLPEIENTNGTTTTPSGNSSEKSDMPSNSSSESSTLNSTTPESSTVTVSPVITSESTVETTAKTDGSSTVTESSTTTVNQPDHPESGGRRFDPPSFIGGIVLCLGLIAIAYVGYKFYRARTEHNYHTLHETVHM